MKKKIITLLIILVTSSAAAQDISLHCTYLEDYSSKLTNVDKKEYDEWQLNIQNNTSEFYSVRQRAYRQLKDSMIAQGATAYEIIAASKDMLKSTQCLTIYKQFPQKSQWTVLDEVFTYKYKYIEEMNHPKWQLTSKKKEILGYKCQQAETDFLGRHWTIWYTPEIPVQEGPWKLWGLPGLILDAEDTNHYFHFYCIEIKKTASKPINLSLHDKHITCKRKKLLAERLEYDTNTAAFIKQRKGYDCQMYHQNGLPMKGVNEAPIYLEDIK